MARHSTLIRIAGLAATILSSRAQAQPPHDECENAISLSPCGSLATSNIGATGVGNIACVSSAWYDVWYSVAVPGPGMLRVYTCPSALDTVLTIHTACPGTGGNMIACNDNDPYCGTAYPGASHVTVSPTGPTTYFIRVAGANNTRGAFTLNTEFTIPNNNCAAAIPIVDGARLGSNICATTDGSADCGGGRDVWYRYTARCNGTLDVFTCPASYDTLISVHSSCPGTVANQLACNDDSGYCGTAYPLTSYVSVPVEAWNSYPIRVSGFNGAQGTFILNTHLNVDTPPNDLCANAIPAGVGQTSFATCAATTDGPSEGLCSFQPTPQIESDVWYRYTAPCSGRTTVSLCTTNFDTRLAVYNANCPGTSGQVIACNDNSCNLGSFVFFLTTAGQQYLIRIGGYFQGSGTMSIVCTPNACYANCDGSAGAPILTANDLVCFINAYAAGESYANCDNSSGNPTLTGNDFVCFVNAYAAGCS